MKDCPTFSCQKDTRVQHSLSYKLFCIQYVEKKACIKVCVRMRAVYWTGVYVLHVTGGLATPTLGLQKVNIFSGGSLLVCLEPEGGGSEPRSGSESKKKKEVRLEDFSAGFAWHSDRHESAVQREDLEEVRRGRLIIQRRWNMEFGGQGRRFAGWVC